MQKNSCLNHLIFLIPSTRTKEIFAESRMNIYREDPLRYFRIKWLSGFKSIQKPRGLALSYLPQIIKIPLCAIHRTWHWCAEKESLPFWSMLYISSLVFFFESWGRNSEPLLLTSRPVPFLELSLSCTPLSPYFRILHPHYSLELILKILFIAQTGTSPKSIINLLIRVTVSSYWESIAMIGDIRQHGVIFLDSLTLGLFMRLRV